MNEYKQESYHEGRATWRPMGLDRALVLCPLGHVVCSVLTDSSYMAEISTGKQLRCYGTVPSLSRSSERP